MEALRCVFIVVASGVLTILHVAAPFWGFLAVLTVGGLCGMYGEKLKALLQRCSTRSGAETTTSAGGTGAAGEGTTTSVDGIGARTVTSEMTE